MKCLEGYIGIRGCDDSEPESGLYINDLPGISLETLDKIADQEQITYLKVFEDIERRALRRFRTLTNHWLGVRYQIRNLTQSANLGKLIDETNITGIASEDRGFAFWLSNDDDYRISNLHVIHVQELAMYEPRTNGGQTITVKIYNITHRDAEHYDGDQVFTYTFTSAEGWNRIPVNLDIKAELGIMCVYNGNIKSAALELPEDISCFCECVCDYYGCCDAKIEGIQKAMGTFAGNVTRGTNTFGLSGIISVGCRFDQFICDNRQNFATALWWLYGYEYWYERIYTNRLNRFGTIDKEHAIKARAESWTMFNDELQISLEGVYLKEDCCVDCNAQVRAVGLEL